MMLVSLERVKAALRIDTSASDELLDGVLIPAASHAVINYLGARADDVLGLDTGGELPTGMPDIPAEVELAVIYLVGHFYRDPDGNQQGDFDRGYLPKPVTALLYPLRDPTLA